MSGLRSAVAFIIQTLAQLYILLLLLRFWLPWLRADFRNPVAQGILRFTSPLILPVRRMVPSVWRLDTATILVAFIVQFLTLVVLALIYSAPVPHPLPLAVTTVIELIVLSLNLFFFAILIRVVLSWVAPHAYNPITALVTTLSEPVLRPFRRSIPTIGGLDISPVFALILIQAAVIFLGHLKPPLV